MPLFPTGKAKARPPALIGTSAPDPFIPLIVGRANPNNEIVLLASSLLVIAAIFQIADGLNFAGVGALRGYKDTQILFFFMFFAYWIIGMPIGYSLAMTNFFTEPMGAVGMWIGLTLGLFISAAFVIARVNYTTGVGRDNFTLRT